MKKLILITVLLASTAAHADKWSAGDTFVEAGVELTLAADWLQTRQICDNIQVNPTDWRKETNPVMGSHCQNLSPNLYFPIIMVAHAAVARVIPWRPVRRVFQGLTIAFQINAIDKNMSAGYTLRW